MYSSTLLPLNIWFPRAHVSTWKCCLTVAVIVTLGSDFFSSCWGCFHLREGRVFAFPKEKSLQTHCWAPSTAAELTPEQQGIAAPPSVKQTAKELFFCIFLKRALTSWRIDVFFFLICRSNACCLIENPGQPSPCPESKVWYEKQLYNLSSENILLLHLLPLIRLEPTASPTSFVTCLKSFSIYRRDTKG